MSKLELIGYIVNSALPSNTKLTYIDDVVQSINDAELQAIQEITKQYSGR